MLSVRTSCVLATFNYVLGVVDGIGRCRLAASEYDTILSRLQRVSTVHLLSSMTNVHVSAMRV